MYVLEGSRKEEENMREIRDGVFHTQAFHERTSVKSKVCRTGCSRTTVLVLFTLGVSVLLGILLAGEREQQQKLQQNQGGSLNGSIVKDNTSSSNDNKEEPHKEYNSTTTTTSSIGQDLFLCDPRIQCETDRWSHSQRLKIGHSMCNDEWRFGVAVMEQHKGALLWQDCNLDRLLVLQEVNSTDHLAFRLTENGVFQVLDNDGILWELESNQGFITPTARCLTDPIMGCPYLHLRKNGGNIVLNWISSGGGWNARKVHKVYPGLFPADFK